MARKSRKVRSKRGSRTHGGGSARKGRHSGEKGGKGIAGSHKHLWRKMLKESPKHFGKHGFNRPPQLQEDVETINVGKLDEYAEELLERDLAEERNEEILINASDLDVDKVLGGGKVTNSLRVRAKEFSESARRKLEEAGGAAETGEG